MPELPVDRVRQMLRELRKVTTVFRLYGRSHPETVRAAEILIEQLVPLLEDLGPLDLEVQAEQLRMGDKTVFEEDESGSFTESLYMEGIQRLVFLPGVEAAEILELIRLLSLNLNLPGFEEETLISLLWQADLAHIRYEAVEGLVEAVEQSESASTGEAGVFGDVLTYVLSTSADALDDLPAIAIPGGEQLVADLGDPVLTTMEGTYEAKELGVDEWVVELDEDSTADSASIEILVPASSDPEDDPDHYRPDTAREPPAFTQQVLQAAQAAGLQEPLEWDEERKSATMETLQWAEGQREELDLPAEQIAAYWQALEADDFESLLSNVLEVLLFLVAHPSESLDEATVVELTRQGMQTALQYRLMPTYLSTLEMLELLLAEGEFAERAHELRALRDAWTDRESLEQVCRMMAAEGEDTDRLADLVERGGVERALVVRDLLSSVSGARRERLGDAVLRAVRHDPTPLGENLGHLDAEQLTAVLTCLARSDHEALRAPLERSLRHPAAEVRMHALSLMSDVERARSWRAVAPLINDRDSAIRLEALASLREVDDPGLESALRRELEPARFKERPADEQLLLARAYARSGKGKAVPALRGILEQSRWSLMSAAERSDLEAALWGLVAVGSPQARKLVKDASKSMLPGLRQAAQKVLDQLGVDVERG